MIKGERAHRGAVRPQGQAGRASTSPEGWQAHKDGRVGVSSTPYGFRWDEVEVERSASLVLRKGAKAYHSLTIKTPRRRFQLDISPSGLLSAFREFPAIADNEV